MYTFNVLTYEDIEEMSTWEDYKDNQYLYMDPYFESHKNGDDVLIGPNNCKGYAVFDAQDRLFGLFEYYFEDGIMEIGLALNPYFRGKSLGLGFLSEGIAFGIKTFDYQGPYIKIMVEAENKPAIRLYEKADFVFKKEICDEHGKSFEYYKKLV